MDQIVAAAVALALVCWAFAAKLRRSRLPLPPGPKQLPIIGNLLDVSFCKPWISYHKWSHDHNSDIIYLSVPTQPLVILGSFEAAIDLLNKRARLYSDRVENVMNKLMTWDFNLGIMPYGPKWRAHRRMFHQYFHPGAVSKYRPVQLKHARNFLSWILKTPEHTKQHVRQMVTAIVVDVTYGKKISSLDDLYVITAEKASEGSIIASVPGAFWVELVPILRYIPSWFPGAHFKRFAEEYLPFVQAMRDKPFAELKGAMDHGIAPECLARTLVESVQSKYGGKSEEPFYDEVARNVAGIAYAAGAETTTIACSSFLLAMALFPEVQIKAQAELGRVVGPNRLPDFEDIEEMPYIRAIGMEAMRWQPALPVSVPHAVIADDEYKGYRIPKGAMIIPNTWAMLHDPAEFPEPEKFKPERFLDNEGRIDLNVRNPNDIAFGFGRRICPGRHFSNNSLLIFIASTLHVFDISSGTDRGGVPLELNDEMTNGLITMPKCVPCGLKPRSAAVAELIRNAMLDMED